VIQSSVTHPDAPAPEAPSKCRREFLPFSPPAVGQEEIEEVVDTLRSGWISTGPKTEQFEAAFKSRVDAPAALAINSCTAGLHLALLSVGVRPGEEVITTPMTFCAGANVIEHIRATPRFADVEPDTLNLDPRAIEEAILPAPVQSWRSTMPAIRPSWTLFEILPSATIWRSSRMPRTQSRPATRGGSSARTRIQPPSHSMPPKT
jgi:hypothetical protein